MTASVAMDVAANAAGNRLSAVDVTLAYGRAEAVAENLTLRVPDGVVTSIIGPNGCGKSTLLRALARLIEPAAGTVLLDGEAIHRLPTKEVARRLGLLPQEQAAPDAITVEDLVRRGRYPHQSFLQPFGAADRAAVEQALELAGIAKLRERPVDELSGGQRQRAWIAMALAQETPILLLDEPTTYLDLAHQQEILELIRRLCRDGRRTVVAVLHDVNAAAWVSDHVVALSAGRIVAEGPPAEVLRPGVLKRIFGVECDVVRPGGGGVPLCVARGRSLRRTRAAAEVENGETATAGTTGPAVTGATAATGATPIRAATEPALRAERLTVGYEHRLVVHEVSVSFPAGKVSAIVGPNASGKSTLLRALAKLLPARGGSVWLNGRPAGECGRRALARRLGMLAQEAPAPEGILVEELVALGRYPHQRWFRRWSREDERAVERALEVTGVSALRWRPVQALSGGQRQRVRLAMALAQETPVLLLDEPTTFLDMAHQIEVLELVRTLNETEGKTVVMVLHDLCQACHYADYLVAMKDGRVVAGGAPGDVVTEELVRGVFGLGCTVFPDPLTGTPLVLPGEAAGRGAGRGDGPEGRPAGAGAVTEFRRN